MHSQERPLLSNHKHDNTRPALSAEAFTQCIAALLGIVKGIVPGDTLNERDVLALNAWLCYHEELLDLWPANVIAERISEELGVELEQGGNEVQQEANCSVQGLPLRPSSARRDHLTAEHQERSNSRKSTAFSDCNCPVSSRHLPRGMCPELQ